MLEHERRHDTHVRSGAWEKRRDDSTDTGTVTHYHSIAASLAFACTDEESGCMHGAASPAVAALGAGPV